MFVNRSEMRNRPFRCGVPFQQFVRALTRTPSHRLCGRTAVGRPRRDLAALQRSWIVGCTALLLPLGAAAQPAAGPYLGLAAGGNFAEDMLSSGATTRVLPNDGALGLADLGWAFGNGLRTEIEGRYGTNDVAGIATRRVNELLIPLGNVHGRLATPAIMADLAYDIDLARLSIDPGLPLRPYLGAGAGYGWLDFGRARGNDLTAFRLPQDGIVITPSILSLGSGGAFAYQAIAGVSLPLPWAPGLDVRLEYRFFGTARADVPVNRISAVPNFFNGMIPSARTRNGFEAHDNSVLIGLRYRFDMP